MRSIPTCVGLGTTTGRTRSLTAVHPHVRGAWGPWRPAPTTDRGPSPRAWGLGDTHLTSARSGRSIPTCVGLGGTCIGGMST